MLPLPRSARIPSDLTELYLNNERLLPLRSIVLTGATALKDGMGLVYPPGALPAGMDLSARALRRWRITINYRCAKRSVVLNISSCEKRSFVKTGLRQRQGTAVEMRALATAGRWATTL